MKFSLKAAVAALALVSAMPASAAITLTPNNGQLKTHVNADDGVVAGDDSIKFGTTGSAPNNVLFDANTNINITGGGFALINDADGKNGVQDFYSLIVNPDEAFSQIDFSLQFNAHDAYFQLEYDLLGDALGYIVLGTFYQDQGLFDYLLDGTVDGVTFDSIRITSVAGALASSPVTIDFEKQNSLTIAGVDNPVPEPATWAMILLGFGAIGYAMRRRRGIGLAQVA